MKGPFCALTIQLTIAMVVTGARVQDRAVQARLAQQEWRFDVDQPDWKPLPEPDPTSTRAVVSRTADALRVTIPDGKRSGSGTLGGAIYVDVPQSPVPFRLIVQARTSASIPLILVGTNVSTSGGFQTWGEGVVPVSDGAVHTYEWFDWNSKDPVRQLGLWFRANEPGSVDILSIKIVRQRTTDRWEYRGFAVDVGWLDSLTNRDAVLQAFRRQFDIVASAGLEQGTLDFFRLVPIVINPLAQTDQAKESLPGSYQGTFIKVAPRVYDPGAPVFLHEFLHAYHDQKLHGGFDNPDILRLFKEADNSQTFPAGSYMMSNVKEYFAMAGSTYLHGSERGFGGVPGTRENLKNRQPALYQWLVTEFGPK